MKRLNSKKSFNLILKSFLSVYHLKSNQNNILLSKYLENNLNLNYNSINQLILLGSIYYKENHNNHNNNNNKNDNHPPKRILNDIIINKDDYIRVYTNTSRYNIENINWKSLILYNCNDYVVVNKPSGISCNPTVGNYQENVSECIRKELSLDKIYLPHRLDSDTTGVLILGKTLSYAQKFKNISYSKKYRALITWRGDGEVNENEINFNLPLIGTTLTHYMENSRGHPKILHQNEIEDSKICQSVVVNRSKVLSHTLSEWNKILIKLQESNQHELYNALLEWINPYNTVYDFYRSTKEEKYLEPPLQISPESPLFHNERIYFCELELELITGRTHQLRAQMQALGNGIQMAGDRIYHTLLPGALNSSKERKLLHPQFIHSPYLALQAYSIQNKDLNVEIPSALWTPLFN